MGTKTPTDDLDEIDIRAARLPRHAQRHRSHRVATVVIASLVGVAVFGGSGAAIAYQRLYGNVRTASSEQMNQLLGTDRPSSTPDPDDPHAGEAFNVLVLGSDERSEELAAQGDSTTGMRSDTAILVHVSADRSHVEAVSIPRDTMVSRPACVTQINADGTQTTSAPANKVMFNSAFTTGAEKTQDAVYGAACAMKTVEQNTGLRVDDFVVVDFDGFAEMVDAVGGVTLCVPTKISDKMSGTFLDPGWHTLEGNAALGYVRARKGVQGSDGSDINRMQRQQKFIAALMREAMATETLANPTKLIPLLSAVTQSLTASETLIDPTKLAGLLLSLKDIDQDNVRFLTAPFEAYPADKNRVQFSAKAKELWQLLLEDTPLTGFDGSATAPSTAGATAGSTATGDAAGGSDAAAGAGAGGDSAAGDATPSGPATVTEDTVFDSTSGLVDEDDEVCGPRPS